MNITAKDAVKHHDTETFTNKCRVPAREHRVALLPKTFPQASKQQTLICVCDQ